MHVCVFTCVRLPGKVYSLHTQCPVRETGHSRKFCCLNVCPTCAVRMPGTGAWATTRFLAPFSLAPQGPWGREAYRAVSRAALHEATVGSPRGATSMGGLQGLEGGRGPGQQGPGGQHHDFSGDKRIPWVLSRDSMLLTWAGDEMPHPDGQRLGDPQKEDQPGSQG